MSSVKGPLVRRVDSSSISNPRPETIRRFHLFPFPHGSFQHVWLGFGFADLGFWV